MKLVLSALKAPKVSKALKVSKEFKASKGNKVFRVHKAQPVKDSMLIRLIRPSLK